MNPSHIIASIICIPLGFMLGFVLAKITSDEKEVVKRYKKHTLLITTGILLTSIIVFIKTDELLILLLSMFFVSMITGVRYLTYKKDPNIKTKIQEGKHIALTGFVKSHEVSRYSKCQETFLNRVNLIQEDK